MKKILIASPNDSLGGAEQFLKNIAGFFAEEDVEVVFFLKKTPHSWVGTSSRIKLKYLSQKTEVRGYIKFFFSSLFAKTKSFDYIFTSHVIVTGLIGLLIKLGKIKKKKFIARESTVIFKRFTGYKLYLYKLQYYLGYTAVDLLICQTDLMKQNLLEAVPHLSSVIKVRVIHNPININYANNQINIMSDAMETARYGKYIVSAGRLIPEKGFDVLIEAFYRIRKNNDDLNLVIFGEGAERTKLENQIKALGLGNAVFLPGFKQNIYPYFKEAAVCVVSSRIEGFPNVLLQMMSQNANVVSTRCAGGIEKIGELITCATGSIDDLARALQLSLNSLHSRQDDRFKVFQEYLKEHTIANFMATVEKHLDD